MPTANPELSKDYSVASHHIHANGTPLSLLEKIHNVSAALALTTQVVERQINLYQEHPESAGVLYFYGDLPFSEASQKLITGYQKRGAITQSNQRLNIKVFPAERLYQPYLLDPEIMKILPFSQRNLPEKVYSVCEKLAENQLTMAYMLGSASILDPNAAKIGKMVAQKGLATGVGGDGRNGRPNSMRTYLASAREHNVPYSVVISTKQLKNQQPGSGYDDFIETEGMIPRIDTMWALAGRHGGLFALQGGMGTMQEILRFIHNNLQVEEESRRRVGVVDLCSFHQGLSEYLTFLGLHEEVDWVNTLSGFSNWLDSLGK